MSRRELSISLWVFRLVSTQSWPKLPRKPILVSQHLRSKDRTWARMRPNAAREFIYSIAHQYIKIIYHKICLFSLCHHKISLTYHMSVWLEFLNVFVMHFLSDCAILLCYIAWDLLLFSVENDSWIWLGRVGFEGDKKKSHGFLQPLFLCAAMEGLLQE